MWFDNGRYIGSLPPGAFQDGEQLTQQKIRARIKEVGFIDPLFIGSGGSMEKSVASAPFRMTMIDPGATTTATGSASWGAPAITTAMCNDAYEAWRKRNYGK